MTEIGSLIFLYTETPLHAGSGVALGAVDLPIQRERMSGLPMVQGSGIKGAWREELTGWKDGPEDWKDVILDLFGPPPPGPTEATASATTNEFAGALALVDARLLLLPVRTVWGGWAWVTSPMILARLVCDLEPLGEKTPTWKDLSVPDDEARVGSDSTVVQDDRLIIEDLEYKAVKDPKVGDLAGWLKEHAFPETPAYKPFTERIAGQLAVISDAEMKFLAEHATEVVARIRIDGETGTVSKGALWSEESLPAETVLWAPAFFTNSRRKKAKNGDPERRDATALQRLFHEATTAVSRIRLGGDRSIGRGLVGVRLYPRKGGEQ